MIIRTSQTTQSRHASQQAKAERRNSSDRAEGAHQRRVPLSRTALAELLKQSYLEWSRDNGMRLGAALAYYAVFSLAPILLICIAIAGLAFGHKAAEGRVLGTLQGVLGTHGAAAVQMLMGASRKPAKGIVAAVLGMIALLVGATGAFSELKGTLNMIWEVKPPPRGSIWEFVSSRFLGFQVVLGIGFLLLLSVALTAALNGMGEHMGRLLPMPSVVMGAIDFFASLAVFALLFAIIFRVLPDAEISWGDVWVGSLMTSLLFSIGKWLIGLYIGKSFSASVYGAAGSLVALIVWLYYSAQILYFGAEFTQLYASKYGSRVAPKPGAERVPRRPRTREDLNLAFTSEQRASNQQGEAGPRQRPIQLGVKSMANEAVPKYSRTFSEGSGPAAEGESANLQSKVAQAAGETKQQVADAGRKTVDKIDEQRQAAASGLESAASTLHESAEKLPGGEKVSQAAHATADKVQQTADYVREHDVNAMVQDVQHLVKRHPGGSLLAAAAVGFLVGRLFGSGD